MKKSEKTRQGLYNVGFIGDENKGSLRTTLRENETTLDDMSRQAATRAATLSAV
jgi:hypothetical protein